MHAHPDDLSRAGKAPALFSRVSGPPAGPPRHDAGRPPCARGAPCSGCCVLLVPGGFGAVGWPAGRAPAGWAAPRVRAGGHPVQVSGGRALTRGVLSQAALFPCGSSLSAAWTGGAPCLEGRRQRETIFGRGPVGLATDCGVHWCRRCAKRGRPGLWHKELVCTSTFTPRLRVCVFLQIFLLKRMLAGRLVSVVSGVGPCTLHCACMCAGVSWSRGHISGVLQTRIKKWTLDTGLAT